MTTFDTKLLTAVDLLRLCGEGVRGELIRGVLHETMPTGHEHGRVVINLAAELRHFAKQHRLGTVVGSDSGIWLERDPDTVREPDIAFTSAERLPVDHRVMGYSEVVPDLVVEVVSPSDSRRAVLDKVAMWTGHGVRLVWVVHPGPRTVEVHTAEGRVSALGIEDDLDGMDVVPGFLCPVSAVFEA